MISCCSAWKTVVLLPGTQESRKGYLHHFRIPGVTQIQFHVPWDYCLLGPQLTRRLVTTKQNASQVANARIFNSTGESSAN